MMFAAIFTALCAGVMLGFIIRDTFAAVHVCAVDAERPVVPPLSPYRIAPTVERIEIECRRCHVDELSRDYNPFAVPVALPPTPMGSKVHE